MRMYVRENEYLTGERGLEIKVVAGETRGEGCVRVTNYSGTRNRFHDVGGPRLTRTMTDNGDKRRRSSLAFWRITWRT